MLWMWMSFWMDTNMFASVKLLKITLSGEGWGPVPAPLLTTEVWWHERVLKVEVGIGRYISNSHTIVYYNWSAC